MATKPKSYDEILANRMKKTAQMHGTSVEEIVDNYGNPADETDLPPVDDSLPPANTDSNPPTVDPNEELLARIRQLESQLSAMSGRVIPEQKRADALQNTVNMLERQYKSQIDALQERLDDATRRLEEQNVKNFSVDDLLTEEEKETMDPSQLAIVTKVAAAAAKRFAPSMDVDSKIKSFLEQDRELQASLYRDRLLSDPKQKVSQLMTLKDDPEFMTWVDQNPDMRFAVSALLTSKTTSDIDSSAQALNKRIEDFYKEVKRPRHNQSQKTDATTSLEAAMRRGPQERTENQQREDLAQMSRRLKELSRTSRGRNSDEARALLEKIQSY